MAKPRSPTPPRPALLMTSEPFLVSPMLFCVQITVDAILILTEAGF